MLQKQNVQLALSGVAYFLLTYFTPRDQFGSFIALYSLLFLSYFWLLRNPLTTRSIFAWGVTFRILFLGAMPWLSDDIYRFLWDGRLWIQGENPFAFIPQYYMGNETHLMGLKELYPLLNSKQYFAIYPPVNQFVFGLAALIVPTGIFKGQLVIKIVLLIGEILLFRYGIRLLELLKKDTRLIALYFLNPLVVLEVCGNLHFEGLMATFLIMAFYYLQTHRWPISALCFALAIGTKLIPLLYLPLLFPLLGFQKMVQYTFITLTVVLLLFVPFLNLELSLNMLESVDLYYQSLSFNAFFYHIITDLSSETIKPYVAFGLAVIPSIYVLLQAFKSTNLNTTIRKSQIAHTVYYLFSAVVHPWYLVTLLGINIVVGFKHIAVWSYVIGLSYFTYRTFPYEESSFIIALEYLTVILILLIEIYLANKKDTSTST